MRRPALAAICATLAALALGCGTDDAATTPGTLPGDATVRAYERSVAGADSLIAEARAGGGDSLRVARIDLPPLPTLSGDTLSSADLAGQVVLLNYWATWCAPCREEIPDLAALQDALADEPFTVVGLTLDEAEAAYIRAFADGLGMNYPVVLDPAGVSAEAAGGVYGLPASYLLRRDGTVAWHAEGLVTRDEIEPIIRAVLAGEEPPAG
jgi:thiol-disulfide isomerase/thioredoxin